MRLARATRIPALLENIRFEQSIFTLPFAYLGMVLAARGLPTLHQFVWITLAMVGARTFGMNMNRLIDLDLDRRNPRAALRPLPSGRLSVRQVVVYSIASVALMLLAAAQLNPLCVALAPIALFVFSIYSYVKRFSWLTHLALGTALGGAPIGGWVAVTGEMSGEALLLGLTVFSWATGFDTLYACGDVDDDRKLGVHTIPVRFGLRAALIISALTHVATVALLATIGIVMGLSWPYWVGVAIVAGLLAYEHAIVSPNDLSRLNVAFFRINGVVSTLLFLCTSASLLIG